MPEKYIQVFTTVEKKEDAKRIAKILLENRLAACVQIVGPIESMYWWKEKIEEATEYLIIIKSRDALYEKLEKAIRENHPYEVPEIIVSEIKKGYKEYISWIDEVTNM